MLKKNYISARQALINTHERYLGRWALCCGICSIRLTWRHVCGDIFFIDYLYGRGQPTVCGADPGQVVLAYINKARWARQYAAFLHGSCPEFPHWWIMSWKLWDENIFLTSVGLDPCFVTATEKEARTRPLQDRIRTLGKQARVKFVK